MQPLTPRSPNAKRIFYPARESHAGNWNILVPVGKDNKLVIPLLAASEKGEGRAESALETKLEMWLEKG